MQGDAEAHRLALGKADGSLVGIFGAASRAGAWILIGVGSVVLLGWLFDIGPLKSIHSSLASMKVNTALAFVLLGASMLRHRAGDDGGLARALAALVTLIGAVSLAERAFGWNFGIDELLFRDPTSAAPARPGLMASTTATNFILLGLALVLLDVNIGPRSRPSEWLSFGAGLSGFLAIVGYLYGVQALYSVGPFSSMALHTAAAFVIASASILFARSDAGMMRLVTDAGPAGTVARRLVPAAIFVPVMIGWLRLQGERLGLYGFEFGLALFAASNVVCFLVLTLWAASALGRADAVRRKSTERFSRLVEAGLIGVVVTDLLRNIREVNEAFSRIVGHSREDLLSGKIVPADYHWPEWADADSRAVEELQETGVARLYEKEYRRKDGTRVPVLVGAALLDTKECIACVLDLTEKKRADQARVELARESAGRERAEAALHNTELQLQQAQKMEAVGRLAGGIAHDFNNLLSIIIGFAELVQLELRKEDPLRNDVEQIVGASKRAAVLTKQLLAFSRQQVLAPQVIDASEVLRALSEMLTRLIGEDIEVAYKLSARERVHVDPGQLEQVLMNLVVNARDAMPKGGRLAIATADVVLDDAYAEEHLGVKPGRHVMISVSDSGDGMDAETQARIFEPFFTTKEQGKGTGLGLSTVFGIVKQSGGHVWVYSELGRGTTFKVYLPIASVASAAPQPTIRPSTTLRGSETILLVEDDPAVRLLARTVLRKSGYEVLEASSGGEALLVSKQFEGTIHLLLTDVVMPSMSGRELAERLAPNRPRLKTIFMSGYTDDAILLHGVLSSNMDFLQKPLMVEPLLTKLREVLDR